DRSGKEAPPLCAFGLVRAETCSLPCDSAQRAIRRRTRFTGSPRRDGVCRLCVDLARSLPLAWPARYASRCGDRQNQAGKDRDMSPQMAPEPELTTVVHTPGPGQDCELVEALRDHEPAAADSLVRAYGERAYRLAARITRNEQDAEEVVQDAFYAVIQKIDTFRGESALRLVALPDRGERRLSETPRPWRPRSTNCRPRTGWSWCSGTGRDTRIPRSPSSSTSALRP